MLTGERDSQLFPGWFDDRRYLHLGLSLGNLCLGWPAGWLKE